MKVNTYEIDDKTGEERLHCANVTLLDCFPEGGKDEEYLLAHFELDRHGRYWGGGGAAPLFLIMRIKE